VLEHAVVLETPDRAVPVLRTMMPAEPAVAMVLADGLSNQEIADHLGKTVSAVKFLLHRIFQKTGIPSRAALVAVLRSQPNRSRKSAARTRLAAAEPVAAAGAGRGKRRAR
jgi:DNA-binding CsgD family transcriptional regulator